MTTKTTARRCIAGFLSLIGAIGMMTVALVGSPADAAAKTRRLAGTFDFKRGASATCTDPASCVVANFKGVIRGPGEGPSTAVFPAQPPTNVVAEGTLVVHTSDGDLYLAGTSVFNPDPASDGEFTVLFKIVGGTGALTGASGYIMSATTSDVPGSVITNARYTGKLVLP